MSHWCSQCFAIHQLGQHLPNWEIEINQAFDGRPPIWEETSGSIGEDAKDAAERWADRYDSHGDYTIVGGSDATIRLRPDVGDADERDDAAWIVMRVRGRTERAYTAEPCDVPSGVKRP